MAARSASSIRAQRAISASRRPHPSQQPVSGEMRQMRTHGLAMERAAVMARKNRAGSPPPERQRDGFR